MTGNDEVCLFILELKWRIKTMTINKNALHVYINIDKYDTQKCSSGYEKYSTGGEAVV